MGWGSADVGFWLLQMDYGWMGVRLLRFGVWMGQQWAIRVLEGSAKWRMEGKGLAMVFWWLGMGSTKGDGVWSGTTVEFWN